MNAKLDWYGLTIHGIGQPLCVIAIKLFESESEIFQIMGRGHGYLNMHIHCTM